MGVVVAVRVRPALCRRPRPGRRCARAPPPAGVRAADAAGAGLRSCQRRRAPVSQRGPGGRRLPGAAGASPGAGRAGLGRRGDPAQRPSLRRGEAQRVAAGPAELRCPRPLGAVRPAKERAASGAEPGVGEEGPAEASRGSAGWWPVPGGGAAGALAQRLPGPRRAS